MIAGGRIDELCGDPDARADLSDASLDDILRAKFSPNALHVDRLSPILEGRVSCDYIQRMETRQRRDDVFGNAVTEILLLRIATHVGKRQHSYGGLLGGGPGRGDRNCRSAADTLDSDRFGDVSQVLRTQIIEADLHSISNVIVGSA